MDALQTVMHSLDLNRSSSEDDKVMLLEQLGMLHGKMDKDMSRQLMDAVSSAGCRAYQRGRDFGHRAVCNDPLVDTNHRR